MKTLFYSFINKDYRKRSIFLIFISALFAMAAGIFTISDNPPGLMLALLSTIAFVFAFVHQWNKPKKYIILAISSVLLFVLTVILHNVFEAFGAVSSTNMLLSNTLNVIGVIFFFAAIFFCPAALFIGIFGSIFWYAKNKQN